ncbi:iron chelate uptake ABC transporter family permease subunit [Corynebacterium sp. MSK044]|uniref:Iron ABC transporter permease n=2 Tax=Corynebacterium TaxID=1716 RepID=A0A2N6T3H1_9CORY|nr:MULTISPECIES: iron chelate uptake ABC transporter family permease subunit [Corynebacterium]KGF21913.1 iron ABC transporter permease [Corynebacterium tuscaniense DNF00037]MCZ9294921.1 iron chelate uptake ABC transporter family permease subunit [Corynebacterium meitnerae]MDK8797789.1 iron chelate uptake ABC transporter family permease subunit [Corynebacterium sp. MSK044]PMC63861.1 iron ABC transporter permease [Corynebacterium tuscaniense]
MIETDSGRNVGAFQTSTSKKRYWMILAVLAVIAAASAWGLLAYQNPMEFGTRGYWLIAERRANSVLVMAIVALCQGMATVAFHTVTGNRIITPSIMGFEALYVAIHTSTVYFFGAAGLINARTLDMFILQLVVMVGFTLLLYSWLLTGENNMHAMLLIGVVIGGGLASLSTFMQRMLAPSEFDVLTARLFGSVNNADPQYFPVAIPLALGAALLLYVHSRTLNVLALGREPAVNLGVNHRAHAIYVLVLVSVLMAISTALVGPMTFLGFLVATLAYQFADTYDHRYIFPMATLIGFVVLTGSYFVMNHIFYAQGIVSIIIELVGGLVFLAVILRKGTL